MIARFHTLRDAEKALTSGRFREEEEQRLLGEFMRIQCLARFPATETRFQEKKREEKGNVRCVLEDPKTNCLLRDCLKILLFWNPEIKLGILNVN